MDKINILIDKLSEYLAHRKGLLPILAILLVLTNFLIQFFPGAGWFGESDLFLHIGLILAILGFMVAWAL